MLDNNNSTNGIASFNKTFFFKFVSFFSLYCSNIRCKILFYNVREQRKEIKMSFIHEFMYMLVGNEWKARKGVWREKLSISLFMTFVYYDFEYDIIEQMGGFGRGFAGFQFNQLLLLQKKNFIKNFFFLVLISFWYSLFFKINQFFSQTFILKFKKINSFNIFKIFNSLAFFIKNNF